MVVAVYHDENEKSKSWINNFIYRITKEGYGFSNNVKGN